MSNSNSTVPSIVNKLARAELVDMLPYESARRLHAGNGEFNNKIWLNANEAAGLGNYEISADCINRYPDFQPDSLINAYSEYSQQPKSNILATRGADEGIELIIRTFCKAYEDNILICPPTYGMYAISAENHGAGIVKVPLQSETGINELDINALKQQVGNAKVVFLCSPGNPTGNLLPHAQIKEVLELFKDTAMVVVDEAYIEFSADKSVASWLPQYDNLIVLRTLSKAFALAGLRCGFTLANSDVIAMLSKVIAPYPISAPVAEIASKALKGDNLTVMTERVKSTNTLAKELSTWLKAQQWCTQVFPTDANFVLFKTPHKAFVFEALLAENILIRDQSKQPQLADCLRISIGSKSELASLKQVIETAFSNLKS
ncbi:histidinol-phosphate transaminase [Pseudocolwellia agarivorans]|uniref:histidinol-phosphate transaminase n=1 Tax=Pseudocolwellia agarivorans TaxID=1911682 RepID=UPI000B5AF658|nr:histidinol-phosphate transaminase [Pseudocolwellia agarivorans]